MLSRVAVLRRVVQAGVTPQFRTFAVSKKTSEGWQVVGNKDASFRYPAGYAKPDQEAAHEEQLARLNRTGVHRVVLQRNKKRIAKKTRSQHGGDFPVY
mmetsp:Transcript_80211/g.183821  ORF Transcript_80211/g.183821 Transcript_80211/m.183821 type:complete len:98 (+) Transcript_80211:41-334(+)